MTASTEPSFRIQDHLNPLDVESLRAQFADARPFPHFAVDGLLREDFAREIAAAYPPYAEAVRLGKSFQRVNETRKVQITEASRFPEPVQRLHRLLEHPDFLAILERITGIPRLLADPALTGGGMHVMGPGARLDVHVDFNRLKGRELFRRLNILLFFNEGWQPGWGGQTELWDRDVRVRGQSYDPGFNRCVVFATSEISFHGVAPVASPPGRDRRSFAAYYYTREAPAGWAGEEHSTIFRARPDETFRRVALMPLDRVRRAVSRAARRVRHKLGS